MYSSVDHGTQCDHHSPEHPLSYHNGVNPFQPPPTGNPQELIHPSGIPLSGKSQKWKLEMEAYDIEPFGSHDKHCNLVRDRLALWSGDHVLATSPHQHFKCYSENSFKLF